MYNSVVAKEHVLWLLIAHVLAPGRGEVGGEPIKLLEVNCDTSMSGVLPIFFGAHAASVVFYPSVIVEVRSEEYLQITSGNLAVSNGWVLGEEFPRPAILATA